MMPLEQLFDELESSGHAVLHLGTHFEQITIVECLCLTKKTIQFHKAVYWLKLFIDGRWQEVDPKDESRVATDWLFLTRLGCI